MTIKTIIGTIIILFIIWIVISYILRLTIGCDGDLSSIYPWWLCDDIIITQEVNKRTCWNIHNDGSQVRFNCGNNSTNDSGGRGSREARDAECTVDPNQCTEHDCCQADYIIHNATSEEIKLANKKQHEAYGYYYGHWDGQERVFQPYSLLDTGGGLDYHYKLIDYGNEPGDKVYFEKDDPSADQEYNNLFKKRPENMFNGEPCNTDNYPHLRKDNDGNIIGCGVPRQYNICGHLGLGWNSMGKLDQAPEDIIIRDHLPAQFDDQQSQGIRVDDVDSLCGEGWEFNPSNRNVICQGVSSSIYPSALDSEGRPKCDIGGKNKVDQYKCCKPISPIIVDHPQPDCTGERLEKCLNTPEGFIIGRSHYLPYETYPYNSEAYHDGDSAGSSNNPISKSNCHWYKAINNDCQNHSGWQQPGECNMRYSVDIGIGPSTHNVGDYSKNDGQAYRCTAIDNNCVNNKGNIDHRIDISNRYKKSPSLWYGCYVSLGDREWGDTRDYSLKNNPPITDPTKAEVRPNYY